MQILICRDINASTAEEPDCVRLANVHDFVCFAEGKAGCDLGALDELRDCVQRRQSYDMQPLDGQTWGSKLLELCQEANLLNGRTDEQSEGSVLVKSAVQLISAGCCLSQSMH